MNSQQKLFFFLRVSVVLINFAAAFSSLYLVHITQTILAVFLLPAYYFVVLPILEFSIGERTPATSGTAEHKSFLHLMYLQIALHFALLTSVMFVAVNSQMSAVWVLIFVASFGLVNGQCTLIGHEFAHKPGRLNQFMSKLSLSVVAMGHFMVEHLRGHHIMVATPEDCASARIGENIYSFALRDMKGEVCGGLRKEADRLRRKQAPWFSRENVILQSYALSLLIIVGLVLWLGPIILLWIVVHHLAAWFTLSIITYIEHYGILRVKTPNGKYEPVRAVHSWNTDMLLSNLSLLNVQRHSDHHARPMEPYQSLENLPAPHLPTGYFGMIALSLLPPLWFAVMDRRVLEAVGYDPARIHRKRRDGYRISKLLEGLT